MNTISGSLTPMLTMSGQIIVPTSEKVPEYTGSYTFTPSESRQIVEIEDMKATQNIVINPVPSSYGRLEYKGSYLRVY